jgi:hypothetical protein
VGEHGGDATCDDVMHYAVEWLGRGGVWVQQRQKFLEQLLYLWRESGDGGSVLGFQWLMKELILALVKVRPQDACRTCCLEGIIESPNFARNSCLRRG